MIADVTEVQYHPVVLSMFSKGFCSIFAAYIRNVSGIYDSYLLLFGKRKIQSFEILCK